MAYYLAYGSNLNINQMAKRCPSAKFFARGLLENYRLMFRRFATIEPFKDNFVPFVIWEIDDECEYALDIYEGFPHLYHKAYIEFELNNQKHTAMVYIENESNAPYHLPSAYYYSVVETGYEDAGFDKSYLTAALENTERQIVETS